MLNSFIKSYALRSIFCFAAAVSTGCRAQSMRSTGAATAAPTAPPPGPPRDNFLHLSHSFRGTPNSTNPSTAVLGTFNYFSGGDLATGVELWKTDGTAAGTTLVKDISAGTESSFPISMTTAGTLVFFNAAYPNAHGRGVWRTDGTSAGTIPLEFTNANVNFSAVGNRVVYLVGNVLHSSDGTVAGTISLAVTSLSGRCHTVGANCYFASLVGGVPTLFGTDGTVAGTASIAAMNGATINGPLGTALIGQTAANGNLVSIDPATGAQTALAAITAPGVFATPLFFGATRAYYRAGSALWATDGTAANTINVATLAQPFAVGFADLGAQQVFSAYDAAQGFGLWRSNGTVAGTAFVKAFPLGVAGTAAVGTTAYFQADDAVSGRELWKSDGTTAGTVIVADQLPGADSSEPGRIFPIGGQAYFFARNAANVQSLWKSNGTAAGTTAVIPLRVPSGPLASGQLSTLQIGPDKILAGTSRELDLVSSTAAPKRLATFGNAATSPLYRLGNQALFTVSSVTATTVDLWISDGTTAGTKVIEPLGTFPNTNLQDPAQITYAGTLGSSSILFVTTATPPSVQVWKSDGTAAGTFLLKDFGIAPLTPTVTGVNFAGRYYFVVDTPGAGNLWSTDGTVAGTVVAGIGPIRVAQPLNTFNNKLLFLSDAPALYLSDGTAAGTTQPFTGALATQSVVLALPAAKNFFLFVSSLNNFMWSSTGTNAGTTDLALSPAGIEAVEMGNGLGFPVTVGSSVLLAYTDGTTGGTRTVPSIPVAGLASQPVYSGPGNVQSFGSTYFLQAQTTYSEPDPVTLATHIVPGPDATLWKSNAALSGALQVRTPSGLAGYLRSPLHQTGASMLIGIGGDDFNPCGEVVYLNSF